MDAPEWPALPDTCAARRTGAACTRGRAPPVRHAGAAEHGRAAPGRGAAPGRAELVPRGSRAAARRRRGTLDATLRESAHEARKDDTRGAGLRLDQAAAAYHLLTSPRTVEVWSARPGAARRARWPPSRRRPSAWRPVLGSGDQPGGTQRPGRRRRAAHLNIAQFLGPHRGRARRARHPSLEPGTFILLDEASMSSIPDLRDIALDAAAHGHKLIVSGDHAQLAAAESGGGMNLLVSELGPCRAGRGGPVHGLGRPASLRLRRRDTLAAGRVRRPRPIRGNDPAEAMEDARRLYVAPLRPGRRRRADHPCNALAREMGRRIRDDLIHLGIVSRGAESSSQAGRRQRRRRDHRPEQRPRRQSGQHRRAPGRGGYDDGTSPPAAAWTATRLPAAANGPRHLPL